VAVSLVVVVGFLPALKKSEIKKSTNRIFFVSRRRVRQKKREASPSSERSRRTRAGAEKKEAAESWAAQRRKEKFSAPLFLGPCRGVRLWASHASDSPRHEDTVYRQQHGHFRKKVKVDADPLKGNAKRQCGP
jgi:hypothetical protein